MATEPVTATKERSSTAWEWQDLASGEGSDGADYYGG
jgi:hypothetical protein